jgi:glycosyltransferase involved in cell wall biosynthesis
VTHPVNRGYGAALISAFEYAIEQRYDALVTIDCDGQHQPRLIPEMAAALFPSSGERVDIVSGSRYLQIFDGDSLPPVDRRRINVEITEQLNERLGLNLTDAFCGFKAYRTKALAKFDITDTGYAMPLQLWVQAARLGMQVVEFPVPLIYLEEERSFGGSLDDAERRRAYYQDVIERELAEISR